MLYILRFQEICETLPLLWATLLLALLSEGVVGSSLSSTAATVVGWEEHVKAKGVAPCLLAK